jgi:uncharacterized protein
MRIVTLFAILLLIPGMLAAQSQKTEYDSTLAKRLGADAYGMKAYVLVILKTGPTKVTDKVKEDSLFVGHMHNIQRLADEGKLVVSGPFFGNSAAYRGLFILNTPSLEEAQKLLETDPTIREKVFEVELYKWYGSAALGEYLPIHTKIQKPATAD